MPSTKIYQVYVLPLIRLSLKSKMYVNIEIINIDVALQSGLCKINLFQF